MLHHCRGACVSQTTAHPVTFEWSQKGEGCVQLRQLPAAEGKQGPGEKD